MNQRALLIDNSTRHLLIGRLGEARSILRCVETATVGENAIDLAIRNLFPDLAEIAEIYLGMGPGSFIGLRSAFAYVRMLAMLRKIPCRTFHSSRLWHQLLEVPQEEWLLMRTNASLFYAERFTPVREALAVDLSTANELGGKIHFYPDSWLVKNPQLANDKIPAHWQKKEFVVEKVTHLLLDLRLLRLSEVKRHDALLPIYGHELNFKLAQGNNG